MANEKPQPNGGDDGGTATVPPPPARQPGPKPRLGKLVIEIMNEDNRSVAWGPIQRAVRGRWNPHNLAGGDTSEAGLRKIPTIPGVLVVVEPQQRLLSVVDPLSAPENRAKAMDIFAKIKDVLRLNHTFVEPYHKGDAPDDEIATWYYWAWRFVKMDPPTAVVIEGRVYSEAEIRAAYPAAKIQKQFYNESQQAAENRLKELGLLPQTAGAE